MKQEFRDRAFLPVALPVGAMLGVLVFAFALSRVLLAVPELVSTFTALLLAAYVLFVAALAAARPRITGRALGVGLFLGLVAVVAAGAVSAAAGMRDLHGEVSADTGAGAGAEGQHGAGPADVDIPEDALVFAAVPTIAWEETEKTAQAGEATLAYTNEDSLYHNVAIDELGGVILEGDPGETAVETLTLEAGTYTYYCDVPGHRQAGMEGTLTVR